MERSKNAPFMGADEEQDIAASQRNVARLHPRFVLSANMMGVRKLPQTSRQNMVWLPRTPGSARILS